MIQWEGFFKSASLLRYGSYGTIDDLGTQFYDSVIVFQLIVYSIDPNHPIL